MIEDESAPYDMRIHGNSSALAWTKFFREHNPECNLDDNVMLGWFANAMMAMHDHIYQTTQPEQDNIQYLLDQVARLTAENAMLKEKWLAQPEQEPVAWIIETEIYGKLSEWVCTDKKHYMEAHDGTKDPIPLYLAPQKREPLSESEIAFIWGDSDYDVAVVRRIEKAHGIGGGE
jgi:hypothetical protein